MFCVVAYKKHIWLHLWTVGGQQCRFEWESEADWCSSECHVLWWCLSLPQRFAHCLYSQTLSLVSCEFLSREQRYVLCYSPGTAIVKASDRNQRSWTTEVPRHCHICQNGAS